MTLYVLHAVSIIPRGFLNATNDLYADLGWGPGNYSVPVSPSGNLPATQYGFATAVTEDFVADLTALAEQSPTTSALLGQLRLDIEAADIRSPMAHWLEFLADRNLQPISSPIGGEEG